MPFPLTLVFNHCRTEILLKEVVQKHPCFCPGFTVSPTDPGDRWSGWLFFGFTGAVYPAAWSEAMAAGQCLLGLLGLAACYVTAEARRSALLHTFCSAWLWMTASCATSPLRCAQTYRTKVYKGCPDASFFRPRAVTSVCVLAITEYGYRLVNLLILKWL